MSALTGRLYWTSWGIALKEWYFWGLLMPLKLKKHHEVSKMPDEVEEIGEENVVQVVTDNELLGRCRCIEGKKFVGWRTLRRYTHLWGDYSKGIGKLLLLSVRGLLSFHFFVATLPKRQRLNEASHYVLENVLICITFQLNKYRN